MVRKKILKTSIFKGESEPFVMELPPYRFPTFKSILMQSKFKAMMYLKKAGTIILTASLIIWFASNFPYSSGINAKYEAELKKADVWFEKSVPYMEKCEEINPEDPMTLESLKNLYYRMKAMDKYNAILEKLGQ